MKKQKLEEDILKLLRFDFAKSLDHTVACVMRRIDEYGAEMAANIAYAKNESDTYREAKREAYLTAKYLKGKIKKLKRLIVILNQAKRLGTIAYD